MLQRVNTNTDKVKVYEPPGRGEGPCTEDVDKGGAERAEGGAGVRSSEVTAQVGGEAAQDGSGYQVSAEHRRAIIRRYPPSDLPPDMPADMPPNESHGIHYGEF